MQLKILTQYIPEEKMKYREGWLNTKTKAHFLTKKGENKAKEDARYLSHLPAKLVGGGKVHGDAN